MLLCIDVGNTHTLGGIYNNDDLLTKFRYETKQMGTPDQFGIFIINILKFHGIEPSEIYATSVCSVVPSKNYIIKHAIANYIKSPFYFLESDRLTDIISIKYKNPKELGSDRVANAIGALNLSPNNNIIVVDMGTATTVCAISKDKEYLGGTIIPGIRIGMESLSKNTARLMEIDLEVPSNYLGRSVKEGLQSGIYYNQLGSLKQIIEGIKKEQFKEEPSIVIGTGGFASLYKDELLFDKIISDLVLLGLKYIAEQGLI